MRRKIKIMLLCIVLCLSMIPISTFATSQSTCNHPYFVEMIKQATPTKDGGRYRCCPVCELLEKIEPIPKVNKYKLSSTTLTYTGKARKPKVTVHNAKNQYVYPDEYSLTYTDNVNVGTATMKVNLRSGYYKGTKTLHFKIVPQNSRIESLNALSKGFNITWKKQDVQTTGYQIQYSTSKNFKSGKKTLTIQNNSITTKKVTKLKTKTNYYVRIRTYTKVNNKNYYSSWSKTSVIKTK